MPFAERLYILTNKNVWPVVSPFRETFPGILLLSLQDTNFNIHISDYVYDTYDDYP